MEICIKWKMCRTCTTDSSVRLQPLFNDNRNLEKLLQQYADINVQPDDGLPDQICTKCIQNLEMVHAFLTDCKRADERLRNVVHRTMSSRSCFGSDSLETDAGNGNLTKGEATEPRARKQIISERNTSLESLIRTAELDEEITDDNDLISSAAESGNEDDDQDSKITLKTNDFLLVVSKSDTEALGNDDGNEYVISDIVEYAAEEETVDNPTEDSPENTAKDATEDAAVVVSMESTAKPSIFINTKVNQKLDSLTHEIDLGAACEPSKFPRHSCGMCLNSFPNQAQLKSHMRTHRNEKNYECELCSKRFNAACNLTSHMRTHTGEKPYGCDHCGRRFADRSTYRKHERMHTNEKPYSCELCGKSFSLSTTLKTHFLCHSNEKPHKCLTCNKNFRLPHQLKAHEKTHIHRYELGMQYDQDEGDCSSS